MPSKNQVKKYQMGASYHIYNRGVEKRKIFLEEEDYKYFMYKLKAYLKPLSKHTDHSTNVTLIAYTLMPNHYHLLVRNERERGIVGFMRSLATGYSMYFNKKYDRVGHLFQGPYKAALIRSEGEFLYKVKYIHENPKETWEGHLENYPYSNYKFFLEGKGESWFDTRTVLQYFRGDGSRYKAYVEAEGELS